MRKRLLIAFVIADVLIGLAVYRGYQARSARDSAELTTLASDSEALALREQGATFFPEARPLSPFSLLDQSGEAFTNASLKGRWSLVFFGFTHCPDICPMTMKELAQFYGQLSDEERERVQVILGTVDPERDDSATMKDYVAQYSEDFVGLTGSRVGLSVLTKQLYVVYSDPTELVQHEGHDDEAHDDEAHDTPVDAVVAETSSHAEHADGAAQQDYLITHSGHVAIIDPQGDFFGVIRPPHRDRSLLTVMRPLLQP